MARMVCESLSVIGAVYSDDSPVGAEPSVVYLHARYQITIGHEGQLRSRHREPCPQYLRTVHPVGLRLVRKIVGPRLGGRPIGGTFSRFIHQHRATIQPWQLPALQAEAETIAMASPIGEIRRCMSLA